MPDTVICTFLVHVSTNDNVMGPDQNSLEMPLSKLTLPSIVGWGWMRQKFMPSLIIQSNLYRSVYMYQYPEIET